MKNACEALEVSTAQFQMPAPYSRCEHPGPRVAEAILQMVPNVAVFRDSLRCIRLWAQRALRT